MNRRRDFRIREALVPLAVLARQRVALWQFLVRAISRRYRVSAFGFLWVLIVPLVTLGIYTFVFGSVMQSRWDTGTSELPFSLQLFAGLIVFWLMADAMAQAPTCIVEHANLVKKAVFPLEIIPAVVVGAALFHTLINTAILLAATALLAHVPATAVLFPLVLVPFVILLIGSAWILAALGVYFRDMAHMMTLILTGLLFLSPVFYPLTRLSPALQSIVVFNPVAFIVIQSRRVLLEGKMPDWTGLAIYLIAAWVIASRGFIFFRKARRTFADVL